MAEYLNLDPDENGPLKVVSEKVDSMVFGTFTGTTKPGQYPTIESPQIYFSPWFVTHHFCSDGKCLFLVFVEAEMPEGFQPTGLPDRF